MSLKILSWNIRQGGGTRIKRIFDAIISVKAHIVVLSEFRNNRSGLKLRMDLAASRFMHQVVGNAPTNTNSVGIFSSLPFDAYHCPSADPIYYHNLLKAKFPAFALYGAYMPHKKKHTLFNHVLKELNGTPAILCGDLNTGKNYIDQKGDSFWYTDKLEEMEERNYVDAFRLCKKAVKEFSWYSHQGNGYRYDHTYIHQDLVPVVKDCYYIHQWREDGLSDHSAMVLEIGA